MGKKRAATKRATKVLNQGEPLRRSKRLNPLHSTPALSYSPPSIIFLSSDDSVIPENASSPGAFPHESSPPRTPLVASSSSSPPPPGSPLRTPITTPVHPSTSNPHQPPSSTDEMKEHASFIIDSLNPKFLLLFAQNQELREEIAALRSQNIELKDQLATLLPSSSSAQTMMSVCSDLKGKVEMLLSQMNQLLEENHQVSSDIKSFQYTVSSTAMDMRTEIQKIMTIIEEDRNYGIDGIAKEVGALKGKIAGAVEEFRKLLSTFEDSQIQHFKLLLNSIATMIGPRAAPPPNDG